MVTSPAELVHRVIEYFQRIDVDLTEGGVLALVWFVAHLAHDPGRSLTQLTQRWPIGRQIVQLGVAERGKPASEPAERGISPGVNWATYEPVALI